MDNFSDTCNSEINVLLDMVEKQDVLLQLQEDEINKFNGFNEALDAAHQREVESLNSRIEQLTAIVNQQEKVKSIMDEMLEEQQKVLDAYNSNRGKSR